MKISQLHIILSHSPFMWIGHWNYVKELNYHFYGFIWVGHAFPSWMSLFSILIVTVSYLINHRFIYFLYILTHDFVKKMDIYIYIYVLEHKLVLKTHYNIISMSKEHFIRLKEQNNESRLKERKIGKHVEDKWWTLNV